MKILNIKILRGPNFWSNNRKKLIEMKLDLEGYEYSPSNEIPGFNDKLKSLIPSLFTHRCSEGVEGGFFERLEEGTWLGHVIEHIALEMQVLAGIPCGFGRTFSAFEPGVYHVIFAYENEEAGLYAAKAAVELVEQLAQGHQYPHLDKDIETLKHLSEKEKLGPSTQALVDEAHKRKIPVSIFHHALVTLGHGRHQKNLWATVSSDTSSIAVDVAGDKALTKQILETHFVPVPHGRVVESATALEQALKELTFPLVIKPLNANHGRGLTTQIQTHEKAVRAFQCAQKISEEVIVEEQIEGDDYRFLVVNYKVVAVAKRMPAQVIGNGKDTIQALIAKVNSDPKRGHEHENFLTTIKIDEATLHILEEKNYNLNTILAEGECLKLKDAANLSSGGTATDVTVETHPENIRLAERIARIIKLDICGLDIISKDITVPITSNGGALIEVNAAPGLRMHLLPCQGHARNVAKPIIDMLFPIGSPCRVPTVAVTGTNGKTTVVRLIAHLAKQHGHHVGLTTTEGIYLDGELIYQGDCSGPSSAQAILQNPSVDFAVLECARGGILRSGLGFDNCDISVITNITSDHLGLNEIHTLEDLARVKGVVARSTTKSGYAILNSEDDLTYEIKNELTCRVALFGIHENERIQAHCRAGGLAAYIQNDHLVIQQAHKKRHLVKVSEVPLTYNGTATCMIQNLLPAALAAVISQFRWEDIAKGLNEFFPTAENLPGRMNLYDFDTYKVMVDYAHNEAGFQEVKRYIGTLQCKKKIGIIGATGDRRPEDIQKIGYYAALMFDEIIIRQDKDSRGKTHEELTNLLLKGISLSSFHCEVKVIPDEYEALMYAISSAVPGTFIYYTVDDVMTAIEYMKAEVAKFKSKRHSTYDTKREVANYRWC